MNDAFNNPTSKLTQAQKQAFLDWMNSKAPLIGKCPLCGARQWSLIDEILELRPYSSGNLAVGGAVYPNLGIICGSCGNTQLVNAVVAGVVAQGAPPEAGGV